MKESLAFLSRGSFGKGRKQIASWIALDVLLSSEIREEETHEHWKSGFEKPAYGDVTLFTDGKELQHR
jgi:hypothetical protein